MKLEIRAWDLDVRLEVEDDNQFNQLELIQNVKNLLDELSAFEKVNFSVVSVPQDESLDEESIDDEADDITE